MNYSTARSLVGRMLGASPLRWWRVRVRAGPAKGARWTAFPFSSFWRLGGETDVAASAARAGDLLGASCWDLGAHFGIHTVGLAMMVGPEGQVAAFEPDPVAFEKLEHHIAINGLRQAKAYPMAASDFDGKLELIIAGGLGSTVTHAKYEDEQTTSSTQTLVSRAVRIDGLVDRGELRAPKFVKIDVEGHGAKAIAGALAAIAASRPLIALSLHSESEWLDSGALLEPIGYRAFDVDTDREIPWVAFPGPRTVVLRVPG